MNTSTASSSYSKEHIPPFTAQYAQRISKIHEQREIENRRKEDDIIHARSAVGSTFRVSGPDHSRVYSGDRTFGLVRPISVGRQRSESAGRSGSASFRSNSAERLRQSNDTQISYSSVQRTMTSFDRELQVQKDIAAIEKQKLALLQVKKESYINYLKNKGNTPWIPGGEGAKYDNSLHKSVNKDALSQRQLKQAWCRSPWPTSVPREQKDQSSSGLNDITFSSAADGGGETYRSQPYGISSQSPHRARVTASIVSNVGEYYAFSPDRMGNGQAQKPIRAATSPQRLPGRTNLNMSAAGEAVGALRDRADSDVLSVYSSAAPSVASAHRSRAAANASIVNASGNSISDNGSAPAGSNSKYVALTVRLINTAHPSQKSSYGVFIVPRNCSRLEMIAHIERQFSVHNQVSDISITYRSGYSHSVTVKSLSMGTIAEVPDVNDYSSITIYLGGSTVFDSLGNIITKSATGEVISSKLAVLDKPVAEVPAPSLARAASGRDFSYNHAIGSGSPVSDNRKANASTNSLFTGAGGGGGGAGVGASGRRLVPGLDVGDTLQYFDGLDMDMDVTFVEDDDNDIDNSTYYSEANSYQVMLFVTIYYSFLRLSSFVSFFFRSPPFFLLLPLLLPLNSQSRCPCMSHCILCRNITVSLTPRPPCRFSEDRERRKCWLPPKARITLLRKCRWRPLLLLLLAMTIALPPQVEPVPTRSRATFSVTVQSRKPPPICAAHHLPTRQTLQVGTYSYFSSSRHFSFDVNERNLFF